MPRQLQIDAEPKIPGAQMVLGLSGWMDGAGASMGTVDWMIRSFPARRLGRIEPEDFYLYSFPGSMEIAAMFRPHTRIEEGVVVEYEPPENLLYYCEDPPLILAKGREPNIRWREYVDCLLETARRFDVARIVFIGSVGGMVPHTREPRFSASVSDPAMRDELARHGVSFSDYEGPASIVTYLTVRAAEERIPMAVLVAEIPAYIQGPNPRVIEAVIRRLGSVLGVEVSLEELRRASDLFEEKLAAVLDEKDDLAELITKLEKDYDNEVFDTDLSDLKQWLQSQGIRLD
jgi:proteasome assembly chaperone (PAC2) family protein